MCQSALVKSDILSVAENEDDENLSIPEPAMTSKMKLKLGGLNPNSINSTKVTALLQDLKEVKALNDLSSEVPVKSVIFSQWTSMLDLIEVNIIKLFFYH